MKKSIVLEKLRRGETVFSFKTNLSCSRSVEIAALAGFDCIWICNEHVPGDYGTMEKQILAARANSADTVVRVPRGSYSDLIKPLELNASGIMVPHVMSAEDAKTIARTVRFHPVGRRPADGGNTDGEFCLTPFAEYIRFVNENRFVMLQIEDREAMEELDEICSVDGIDILFFGPGDYSQSIGHPGEIFHPEVTEARRKVAETARRHGKFAATTGNTDNFRELMDLGYRFINISADVIAIGQHCKKIIQTVTQ